MHRLARNISERKISERSDDSAFVLRLTRSAGLSASDIESLLDLLRLEAMVRKRRDVVIDGYEYGKLCFIEEGVAVRYKLLRNGKRQIVNVLLPGDLIGIPGSFLKHANFSVVSITDMTLQVCAFADFVALCYRQPKFGLALSWLAVQELTVCAEHLVDIGRRNPLERLAHFLLEIHSRLEAVGRVSGDSFELPISQEIMSDALGLSVPHLNRTLAKLRADGLIGMQGHVIELLDRPALAVLAHYQPVIPKPVIDPPHRGGN